MTAATSGNDRVRTARRVSDDECHACGDRLGSVRRSERWGFDVGTCVGCGTVSALGAARMVDPAAAGDGDEEPDWDVYSDRMHVRDPIRYDVLEALRRRIATGADQPTLFDVGAGTGAFLDMARADGFEIAGNDISRSAVAYASATYGIALSPRGLEEQPTRSFDAITMWCVVAHVGDPHAFLADAFQMLRPGGVLFLRTPRWCGIDAAGGALARATRGRIAQLPDHRLTRGHLHLYRDTGMEHMLRRIGFTDVDVQPVAHTGCTGEEIARRLGGPRAVQGVSARLVDRVMTSGAAPRNSMFVYARRPLDVGER